MMIVEKNVLVEKQPYITKKGVTTGEMTLIEAKKVLEMFLHKQCDLKRTEFAYNEREVWCAVKMANEALEKQIPKKPKIKYFLNIHGLSPYEKLKKCPSCGGCVKKYKESWIYPPIRNNYCNHCGQALDWGNSE